MHYFIHDVALKIYDKGRVTSCIKRSYHICNMEKVGNFLYFTVMNERIYS